MGGVVAGGIVRAQARERIDLPRAHGAGEVDGYRRGELGHFAFVVAPIQSKTEERVTERVFVDGVEVHEIRFVGEVLPCETDGCGAVIVEDRGFLPIGTPGGFDGGGQHTEDPDGLKSVATRREVPAANEAQRRAIEIVAVKIAEQKSSRAGAHEAIKRPVKKGGRGRYGDLVREIAADRAAACGGIVWFADAREQQQPRVVKRPGGEEDKRGGLKEFPAGGVDVADAASGRLGSRVKEDAANPGPGANRDVLALLNDGEKKARGLRLSPNHATEPGAESAVRAAAARNAVRIGVSLADVCGGRGIRMIAE